MNKEELREKISNISNSCFPLIDFFNDIGRNKESRYDKEKAYEDIEKIYDVFMFYKEKCEKLEKDLRQTKLNFKNSQTHSKTHYKKLLDRYMSLEKQNQELLVNKNVAQGIATKFKEENDILKKVIEILEKRLGVKIKVCINGGCSISILVNDRLITPNNEYLKYIDKEEYELLERVLKNERNGESKKKD